MGESKEFLNFGFHAVRIQVAKTCVQIPRPMLKSVHLRNLHVSVPPGSSDLRWLEKIINLDGFTALVCLKSLFTSV